MNFKQSDLKALAAVLIEKGAPVLGGIIGGPIGPLIAFALPKIAEAFGLSSDASPAYIAQVVSSAPGATDRLLELEEEHKSAQAYYDSQIAANRSLADIGETFWQRFLVAGARPIMMWVSGPLLLIYELLALRLGWTIIPFDFFAASQATFAGLAGFRTVEKWKGVETTVIKRK